MIFYAVVTAGSYALAFGLPQAQKSVLSAEAQAKRAAALRDYARLSRLKFDNGYAGDLEVLYAENELFGAELNSARSQADRYLQVINVYKAVGGGWVDEAGKLAPQPLLRKK